MTQDIDVDDLILQMSLATINLTGENDVGILAFFEAAITALKSQAALIAKLSETPVICGLPENSNDKLPCAHGCPIDGVCRAIFMSKKVAVTSIIADKDATIAERDTEIAELRERLTISTDYIEKYYANTRIDFGDMGRDFFVQDVVSLNDKLLGLEPRNFSKLYPALKQTESKDE